MSKYLPIPQIIKDAFRLDDKDIYKQFEKYLTLIGTRGSGKTTIVGLIELICEILSTENPNFMYRIDELTSGGISQISTDLCAGVFPKETPAGKIYQADIYLNEKSGFWGTKSVRIGVAETAGEDIENLMGPYRGKLYEPNKSYQDAENLNRMISASQGFILTIAVPRSTMPLPQNIDDAEPSGVHPNPDLNAYRILNAILKYKQKRGAQPCEGIGVFLTKYDMVDTWVKERGMGLYDPIGVQDYLGTYFRKTMGILKNYGLEKVRFFPIHVQVEKQILPDGSIRFLKWDANSGKTGYKIAVDAERNLPFFSEYTLRQFIPWALETFGS